jgi:DNA-binding response OmpR family regulator
VKPLVWIIDADHWPRAYLRAELIERGYEAVGFVTVADALAALALQRRPLLATIDLQGQSLDAKQLAPLLRAGFPIVAIGGINEWGTTSMRTLRWAAILRRPLRIGAVADAIGRLIPAPGCGR